MPPKARPAFDPAKFFDGFVAALPDPNDPEAKTWNEEKIDFIRDLVRSHQEPLLDSAIRVAYSREWYSWHFYSTDRDDSIHESFVFLNPDGSVPKTPADYRKIWEMKPAKVPSLTIWERRHTKFKRAFFALASMRESPRSRIASV